MSHFLGDLAIKDFRAFKYLQIKKLGQVNLIVGRNNVGKTCLLEALTLYASRGSVNTIKDILTARNEFAIEENQENKAFAIRHLFYSRPDLKNLDNKILTIKPVSRQKYELFIKTIIIDRTLANRINQGHRDRRSKITLNKAELEELISELTYRGLSSEALGIIGLPSRSNFDVPLPGRESLAIIVTFNEEAVKLIDHKLLEFTYGRPSEETPHIFVSTAGLDSLQSAQLWDNIYLTPQEDDVVEALRIIEPDIKSVGLVESSEQKGVRIPRVRLSGHDSPVLLSSLGEGMNRIFGLTLALANVKNGFLLVDEIGNGIHYSAQPQLWNFLFQVAKQLNVQIFATTHSWDVIEAFQEAAQVHNQVEGVLISLRNKLDSPGQVVGTIFTEQDLEIVTRDQIEIR